MVAGSSATKMKFGLECLWEQKPLKEITNTPLVLSRTDVPKSSRGWVSGKQCELVVSNLGTVSVTGIGQHGTMVFRHQSITRLHLMPGELCILAHGDKLGLVGGTGSKKLPEPEFRLVQTSSDQSAVQQPFKSTDACEPPSDAGTDGTAGAHPPNPQSVCQNAATSEYTDDGLYDSDSEQEPAPAEYVPQDQPIDEPAPAAHQLPVLESFVYASRLAPADKSHAVMVLMTRKVIASLMASDTS